jgi:hypothetical protein
MKKVFFLAIFLTSLFFSVILISPVLAAGPLDITNQEGFGAGGDIPGAFGQGSTPKSPIEIASNIINIVLSLLGIILVCLLVYAGFLWMTAAGDEGKVEKALGIIKTSIIGLIIILAAWAISYFVIKEISQAVKGGHEVRIIGTGNEQ